MIGVNAPFPGCAPLAVAQVLGVPLRTVNRWARQGSMPAQWALLYALYTDADLGVIDERWRGFKLREGSLILPEGTALTHGELRAVPMLEAMLSEYRRRASAPAQLLLEV